MTFSQLKTFLEVARQGSIRGAAATLVVTEPSVSAAIATLSREMGVGLLEREGRGVRLTPAGKQFAAYAAEILGLSDQAIRRVRETAGGSARLHLAAVTTAGEQVLPPILKIFKQTHPGVQIWMEVGNRVSIFEYLHSREADLAIGGRPPSHSRITGEPFLENRLVVVGAPDHPAASKRSTDPQLLSAETWLVREPGSGTREALEKFLVNSHIDSPVTMTLGSNGAVKQAAIAGLGITLLSTHAVAAELASGSLVRLKVPGTPLRRDWYVNYLTETPLSGSVQDFLGLLRSRTARQAVDDWFGLTKKYVA